MLIVTGTHTNGVTLTSADSPALISGLVTHGSTDPTVSIGVYGAASQSWTVRNFAVIGDAATLTGIQLNGIGTVSNGAIGLNAAAITGGNTGVLLNAGGSVANYATITGMVTAISAQGPLTLVNGATNATAAHIVGGAGGAVYCNAYNTGTVTNFGTIETTSGDGVILRDGGTIINGAAQSFAALIDGSAGVSAFGTVKIMNFGVIGGFAYGIQMLTGSVTNGSNGSQLAIVAGYTAIGALGIATITNFATITGAGDSGRGVVLEQGGTIVNGSNTAKAATIQAQFIGVEADAGITRITNFGTIHGVNGIVLQNGGVVANGGSTDKTARIIGAFYGIKVGGSIAATVTDFGTISGYQAAISFGSGSDALVVESGAVLAGAVSAAGGVDTANFLGGGSLSAAGFTGFENFVLSSSSRATLTLTNANFTDVNVTTITVDAGPGGATLNAGAGTRTSNAIVNKVVFVGGAGADIVTAANDTRITGGGGANEFVFVKIGTNTITDFAASAGNEIVISNAGFHLGLSGASAAPQALPASLFVANATGGFTNATQRFSYNTTNGQLHFDADGSGAGSSAHLVATLTGHPALSASHLFFVT